MRILIPCLYASYGRYITRYRAFPYDVDCLKLSERRILLTTYDVAKDKLVKAAKVIGNAIAELHPHGDQACFSVLQTLVDRGFIKGEGNWGTRGLEDSNAAAYRYVECKLEPWIRKFAFEYINYVSWENFEFADEPLALPAPLPLGLIGSGLTTGIAFHKALIPRYKSSALAKRLNWLLSNPKPTLEYDNDSDLDPLKYGPVISPYVYDCTVKECSKNQFYNIIINGFGRIKTLPNGKIEKGYILIKGRSPNSSFTQLVNACSDERKKDTKKEFLDVRIVDKSKKDIDIKIIPYGKITNLNDLFLKIWSKYLIEEFNISNIISDKDGQVSQLGVDDILLNNYAYWRHSVFNKRLEDCIKANKDKVVAHIIKLIRGIISKHNVKKVDDIITHFNTGTALFVPIEEYCFTSFTWKQTTTLVKEEDIREVCAKSSIKKLIEVDIDMQVIDQNIQDCRKILSLLDTDCQNVVLNLTTEDLV